MVKRWKGDGPEELLVMTLAMDGIAHLCRAGLIDVRTTIKVGNNTFNANPISGTLVPDLALPCKN